MLLVNSEMSVQLNRLVGQFFDGDNRQLGIIQGVLSRITRIWPNSDRLSRGTNVGSGLAISPEGAVDCFTDWKRTEKFIKGVDDAIRQAQFRFPKEKIRVLYAGCGPFAPLATLLTTRFSSDEVEFTLLDIHQNSLLSVEKIIQAFGIRDYFKNLIHEDATRYKSCERPHIIVAEMMSYGLSGEPQFAATNNLGSQLVDGGLFVPEAIELDVYCTDESHSPRHFHAPALVSREFIGNIFELRGAVQSSLDSINKTIEVPSVLHGGQLYMRTQLQISPSQRLCEGESAITKPFPLSLDIHPKDSGKLLSLIYKHDERPGFIASLTEPT